MVVAHNAVHHGKRYPSRITLAVLPPSKTRPTDPYHHKGKSAKSDKRDP